MYISYVYVSLPLFWWIKVSKIWKASRKEPVIGKEPLPHYRASVRRFPVVKLLHLSRFWASFLTKPSLFMSNFTLVPRLSTSPLLLCPLPVLPGKPIPSHSSLRYHLIPLTSYSSTAYHLFHAQTVHILCSPFPIPQCQHIHYTCICWQDGMELFI